MKIYDARQAEISDERTRIKSAEEKGKLEGREEAAINFLRLGVDEEIIAKGTGLPMEKIIELKKKYQN
jgi:hypothetical protein